MPELPEVEQFRAMLLPLVSSKPLRLSLLPDKVPPKVWINSSQIASLGDECCCADVLRKGKQLVMVLKKGKETVYLFLHMGMTGSIVSPGIPMGWGHEGRMEKEDAEFPAKYAYLLLETDDYKACFSDPRKFGKTELRTDLEPLEELAPDALAGPPEHIIESITQNTLGIKALLLDQKKACAGVGNWVADEVLYQCGMHPDQSFLSVAEATRLVNVMQTILGVAVKCLTDHVPYPADWLFPYRWTKKKAGKDGQGKSITFLKSGGRTSAIIAAKQRLYKRKRPASSKGDENAQNKKVKKETKKKLISTEGTVRAPDKRRSARQGQRPDS